MFGFGEDKELTKKRKQLEESIERMVIFFDKLSELFNDLADLDNPDIDIIFDKYQVTIPNKYPR